MKSVEKKEVSLPVGVVVEKRKSSHPWGDWIWKPVAVFSDFEGMGLDPASQWKIMRQGEDHTLYFAATLPLVLHRSETEAFRLNLMNDRPELYVVLRENTDEQSQFPWLPFRVTASPYDAQDFADIGDDILEKVEMSASIAAFIQQFVEVHHVEESFRKRRRDKLDLEEHKFGKEPIFQTGLKPNLKTGPKTELKN